MINSLSRVPVIVFMLVLLLVCLTYWGNAQAAGCTNTHYKFRWQTTQLDDTVTEFDTNQVIAKFGGIDSAIQNTEEQIRQFQATGTQDSNAEAYRNFMALKQELEACRSGGQSSAQSASSGQYMPGSKGPGGGIVFYVDNSGSHGLEAKTADEAGELDWTAAIIAASAYGSGWRLPTKDELNLLYQQKTVVGGFANDSYWSSTENNRNLVGYQYFPDGNQDNASKSNTLRVRAVRAF